MLLLNALISFQLRLFLLGTPFEADEHVFVTTNEIAWLYAGSPPDFLGRRFFVIIPLLPLSRQITSARR